MSFRGALPAKPVDSKGLGGAASKPVESKSNVGAAPKATASKSNAVVNASKPTDSKSTPVNLSPDSASRSRAYFSRFKKKPGSAVVGSPGMISPSQSVSKNSHPEDHKDSSVPSGFFNHRRNGSLLSKQEKDKQDLMALAAASPMDAQNQDATSATPKKTKMWNVDSESDRDVSPNPPHYSAPLTATKSADEGDRGLGLSLPEERLRMNNSAPLTAREKEMEEKFHRFFDPVKDDEDGDNKQDHLATTLPAHAIGRAYTDETMENGDEQGRSGKAGKSKFTKRIRRDSFGNVIDPKNSGKKRLSVTASESTVAAFVAANTKGQQPQNPSSAPNSKTQASVSKSAKPLPPPPEPPARSTKDEDVDVDEVDEIYEKTILKAMENLSLKDSEKIRKKNAEQISKALNI